MRSSIPTGFRCGSPTSATLLANKLLFEDRCALPDQMSFVLTFPWRAFVFAMGKRDCTNLDKIAISVLSVTTKHFPHDMPLPARPRAMLTDNCNRPPGTSISRLSHFLLY